MGGLGSANRHSAAVSFPSPQAAQRGPPPPGEHRPQAMSASHVRAHCHFSRKARGSSNPQSAVRATRHLSSSAGNGPAGVRAPRADPGGGRAGARRAEETPVLGAEDWDFVGQLNRHPHLARKDPALSSRPPRSSGCAAAPTGFLGLGQAARSLHRALSSGGVPQRDHLSPETSAAGGL